MNRLVSIAVAALLLLSAGSASPAGNIGAEVVFTDSEITAIRAWYRDNPDSFRQGHGKKGSKELPPGIARNLARGKPLPPGIAKQALPGGLIAMLPPVKPGYERVIVDGRLLLVEVATQIVHDVLSDMILR
ncbi:MAG: anti-virulence regulator CigR family protein [Gammaproteobacteria bacterium]|nr:anti-virulence regulator CigR family protein [Gammaproteobacteria bacterium]